MPEGRSFCAWVLGKFPKFLAAGRVSVEVSFTRFVSRPQTRAFLEDLTILYYSINLDRRPQSFYASNVPIEDCINVS